MGNGQSEGGNAERAALVERHLGLVRSIAGKVKQTLAANVELDELVGYGTQGLIEATQRFDVAKGASFGTFAYYRIRGAIYDGVRLMGWLSRGEYARHRATERADGYLAELANREAAPTHAATAESLEDRVGAMADALDAVTTIFVLSSESLDEFDPEDRERPAADAALERHETVQRMRGALHLLPERERLLLEACYFGDKTLQEAGKELGLSKSWASRLHARAIDALRVALTQESPPVSTQPTRRPADTLPTR